MKFIIRKEILLENINVTARALSSKNLIPILAGIKFDLREDGLYLIASDNDITIQTFIENGKIDKIEELGDIVIPGKYIVEIIRKIPSDIISIEKTDGNKIFVSFKNGEFNINGMDANGFPKLEIEETPNPVYLKGDKFKEIISETVFAISSSESRPILTGLNIRINKDILECYATDSYRLSKKTVSISSQLDNINIVIPGRNIVEFKNIINDSDKEIQLHIFDNKVLFKKENILFQSKLLSGNYPEVSKLIPNEFKINVEIDTSDLYSVIDRSSLLSNDRDKVIIRLEMANSKLNISSNTPELGKVEEYIDINSDDSITISFVSKYMLEALKSFCSRKVSLCFNEEDKPFILKDESGNLLIQLILPIKTY